MMLIKGPIETILYSVSVAFLGGGWCVFLPALVARGLPTSAQARRSSTPNLHRQHLLTRLRVSVSK